MGKKDYLAPTISTYQFFDLTDEQKKEFKRCRLDVISKRLEKKLMPLAARHGGKFTIENHLTKNTLTIESPPHWLYNGPTLWSESNFERLEHLACSLPEEK